MEIAINIYKTMPYGPATLPVEKRFTAMSNSKFLKGLVLKIGLVTFNGNND